MATHPLAQEEIVIRKARPEDAEVCGRICYEAFAAIADQHNFPRDFPSPGIPQAFLKEMFAGSDCFCVVAERNGEIVGSNCMDTRSAIFGIGPITIAPGAQNRGVGRKLMEAAIAHTAECGAAGVRLVQAAYHNRSLSLYTKLGFDPREPLSLMQGEPLNTTIPGYTVRKATDDDHESCNRLCRRIHGHDRSSELLEAIHEGTASIVERGGRITGYTTHLGFIGHSVAETNDDLEALIGAAPEFFGPGFLIPTRNAELLRWCLNRGLRIVQPMTLMSIGIYNEPAGAYLPSILF